MSLAAKREALLESLEEDLLVLASGDDARTLGSHYESLAAEFQSLGICNLLLTMDAEGFHRNLIQSAFARRHFLIHAADSQLPVGRFDAISRVESIFDAIAAGAFNVAQEIAQRSVSMWIESGEYEDDYCYYQFLHDLVKSPQQPDARLLVPLLERFESALEGADSARLAVCRALLDRDADQFNSAFFALLDEHAEAVEILLERVNVDLVAEPRSRVFVEGLALLRLAATLGLPVDDEYRFCPSPARTGWAGPLPDDLFAELDSLLAQS